jgi:fermentation-respiration switch protein FrsA (DUF1100 family)
MNKQPFSFISADATVVGDLYVPDRAARGVSVVTGPLTSVKEQAAGTYAAALAERGYAALAFDYRHFGDSGGEPRQLEDPEENITDIRNAVTALANVPVLADLPAYGVGVCFGAGPMAVAVSRDARFHGFAGVAGVYTDQAETQATMGSAYDAVVGRGRAAEKAWRENGETETIPAVAPDGGDVAMPLREAYEFYGTARGAVPNYTNGFAVASYAHLLPFDAQGAADNLSMPVAIVHSETALAPDLAHRFFARLPGPKDELWLTSQGQIDFYDDPALVSAAADRVVATFAPAT